MEHVMNIAFEFDDDRVKKIAEDRLEEEITKITRGIILDFVAPEECGYYGRKERNWIKLREIVDNHVREVIDGYRDEIIELAVAKIVESVRRTKKWKEKVGKGLDGEE